MKLMTKVLTISMLGLLLSSAGWADIGTTIQAGITYVAPRGEFTPLSGPFLPANTVGLQAVPQKTMFLGITQDLGSHFQLDLLGGIPPRHDVKLQVLDPSKLPPSSAALNGAVIAKVTQLAPTLLVNYRFGAASNRIRPFIGLGYNFTDFIKTESTSVGNAVNGGQTNINLNSSNGIAAQAGITASFYQHWSATASLLTARVHSTLTSNTLGVQNTSNVLFRPVVATLALGYSF